MATSRHARASSGRNAPLYFLACYAPLCMRLAFRSRIQIFCQCCISPPHHAPLTPPFCFHVRRSLPFYRNKAKIDATNQDGYTPLILASEMGHLAVVKLLKAQKADLEAKMEWGRTALDYATEFDHKDIIAELTPEGTDVKKAGRR